ncbi:hypothetical protein SAMN05444320_1137 [Streptoalloteichus hindustanus]|uniref:Uncharacterized protein n=1 Tax=Streptoalloteichus hindustanus TaxID=2017 RepID=A0A1M5M6B4_STRHI|nr:hypothetical protein SAMN05444320_1137 [Streptoalloteichus hindustanus]
MACPARDPATGYPPEQIAPVITHVMNAGAIAPLEEVLHTWRTRLHHRSRAMLNASAHYLDLRPPTTHSDQ